MSKGKVVELCSCRFQNLDWFRLMGIPKRFFDAELDNYVPTTEKQKTALSICKLYAVNFDASKGEGLVLVGASQMGKTHLAVGILKTVYRLKQIKGLFFDTKDLFFRLGLLRDSEQRYQRLLLALLERPLLVLDDLGSEMLSDWRAEVLSHIITYRYNHLKSTIITTSYPLRRIGAEGLSLEERLSEGVVAKILQSSVEVRLS